jgi:hypothetical protein
MLKTTTSVINASQITGVLPVANGGTGVTTSTGTGSVVLNTSPTFTALNSTGTITQTATAATNTQGIFLTGSTTGANFIQISNTSASALIGVEGSAGGYLSTGASPYSLQLRNTTGRDVQIAPNGTVVATFATAGRVGIGTSAPAYQLELSTDSAGKPGVGGLWTVVSDERIKSNIVPANLDRCYEIVKSVPLKHFGFAPGVYTDDQIQDKNNLGWIAQDVQKVFKNAVSVKPFTLKTGNVIKDCLDLNGGQMHAAMYGAIQALMKKVEVLEARLLVK